MGEIGRRSNPRSVTVIPYRPRAAWIPFHESAARFRVAVAHRRAGKTVALVNEAIKGAALCGRLQPRFGYIAPLLGQAKAIAWDYVRHYAGKIEGTSFNENELRADLPNGGRLRLFGADNPDALRGVYFDGVILDEFGDMDPRVWTEVVRPMLSDRLGWAAFAGTPRGKNQFYALAERARKGDPGWEFFEHKASESNILSAAELADAKTSMDEAAYAREYECSFDAAVAGAYYASEMAAAEADGRICRVPLEPMVKVDTAWDIGIDDATAIWFVQDVGRERRLIDYLEVSGESVVEIAKRLEARNYRYGRHIFPHDADAREKSNGRTYRHVFDGLGLGGRSECVPRTLDLLADINLTRLHLARCWFDAERCARGLESLKQYRRQWDGRRQTWESGPLHDWASHGADAFRALVVSRRPVPRPMRIELPNYGIY